MQPEIVLFYSIVSLAFFVILFFITRLFMRFYQSKKNMEQKDMSQVGFVVDTFHDLVSQLKEKERELEVLRNKAEDRAIAIEGYNENILQSVPSGVISLDEEMKITKVNHAAEHILEIRGETALRKHHSEVLGKPITEFLNEKRFIERGEVSYTTPSGKRIWLGLTLSPLKDRDDKRIGQILVFTDLTHLKAIEAQIQLRDKLSSLGEISAGIAHELRNPMGVIAGYTKILSKKVDDPLRTTVDAISREIVVMNRIISDFLSFAKPVEITPAPVNLKEIIKACVASSAGPRNDITVSMNMQELPLLKGDDVLLRQAFTNLIQNAAEAMPQGGKLLIKTSSAAGQSGDILDILISDTGHGISENVRDKIFLPFFTTKEKGTGLGLAIVHKIVISHGGTIAFVSSEKGTTFRIRLPLNA
jgi:PAS domain S-box-containing protein